MTTNDAAERLRLPDPAAGADRLIATRAQRRADELRRMPGWTIPMDEALDKVREADRDAERRATVERIRAALAEDDGFGQGWDPFTVSAILDEVAER
jgi:hypothetical protein